MIQTYDSLDLLGVVSSLENEPITFLRDRFFSNTENFESEEIHFDVIDKARRLAPFVSPLVQGKVVEREGFTTRFFRPAYVKPKSSVKPTDTIKRRAGEVIGGNMSPAERRAAIIRQILEEHVEMLDMREEVMASEILRTGKVTISGEGFGTVVLDYGRHADLSPVLTGNDRWDQDHADSDPMADLRAWALKVRQKSNAVIRDAIMEPNAFAAFLDRISDDDKKLLFDSMRASGSRVELGPRLAEKARFEGMIGEFNFWTYSDTYTDEEGDEQQAMPDGSVILASTAIEGVRAYGAILDARALHSERIWPKMWEEQDPSREWVMSQSAPLLAPLRPNASLGATVF